MSSSIRLRRWQRRALDRLDATPGADFLAVATPGAGKTTFALTAIRRRLAETKFSPVIVVAPTAHLKTQWAQAARRFDLILDDQWRPTKSRLPDDIHGLVTTYQQVASTASALSRIANGALVILDEIHHAGDERAWGQGIRDAFGQARFRLALSGTPFRSDSRPIPFIRYALDEAMPDFEYGYGEALADSGVIRHIEFPSLNGDMEWIAPDGALHRASFRDALDPSLAAQRLRTALSPEGEWLPAVLDAAHERLLDVRRLHHDAGGLVIATDQDHARSIGQYLQRRHGIDAVVATSDDAEASTRIARFATSRDPWLVAVRMVSEGVDIPRLSVGVFATTTTTELFFRQAVGRFVRHRQADAGLAAWMFIPDDHRLRARAADIARVRRHHLKTRTSDEGSSTRERVVHDDEQMSLFAPLSATPVGEASAFLPMPGSPTEHFDDDPELILELPPLPTHKRSNSSETETRDAPQGVSRHRHLRTLNAARAADLVRYANLPHARVNAELNRLAGITKITEASEAELERRLAAAEKWLRS